MKSATEVESLFSQKASTWNEKYAADGPLRYRLDAFAKQLRELAPAGAKVLDFGCGTGNLAGHLNASGYKVIGCDISAKMIEQARENNRGAAVDWIELPVDWKELPFAAEAFDAVVASSAFEYLTDVAATLGECRRVLKPGGCLIATVPNPRAGIRRMEKWLRPAAIIAGSTPLASLMPKFGSYANYLKCSRNRMALEEWNAIGARQGFTAIKQDTTGTGEGALVFLRFQKQPKQFQTTPKKPS